MSRSEQVFGTAVPSRLGGSRTLGSHQFVGPVLAVGGMPNLWPSGQLGKRKLVCIAKLACVAKAGLCCKVGLGSPPEPQAGNQLLPRWMEEDGRLVRSSRLSHLCLSPPSPPPQVHTCSVCQEVFKKRVELRLHMVTHTGEMPYKVSLALRLSVAGRKRVMGDTLRNGSQRPDSPAVAGSMFPGS